MAITGQLWYAGNGAQPGDTPAPADGVHGDDRIGYLDSDGSGATVEAYNLNNGSLNYFYDVGLDTADNLYFGLTQNNSDDYVLVDGSISAGADQGRSLANQVVVSNDSLEDIVNSFAVDYINHVIYMGIWGQDAADDGIVEVSYNPQTGALTSGYDASTGRITGAHLLTNTSTSGPGDAAEGGSYVNGSNFFVDPAANKLYYVDFDNGDSSVPGAANANTNGVYVVSTTGTGTTQGSGPQPTMLTLASQFPATLTHVSSTNYEIQMISAMTVDVGQNLIFFTTDDVSYDPTNGYAPTTNYGTTKDALYWMPITGGTATAVTLPTGVHLYDPGESSSNEQNSGLTLDPNTQTLYVSDQQSGQSGRIVQLGLTISKTSGVVTAVAANAGNNDFYSVDSASGVVSVPNGLAFAALPTLTVTGTSTHAVQGGSYVTAAASAPTLTDVDSNIASVTVSLGSTYKSGDVLGINGTAYSATASNVTVGGVTFAASWNSTTGTLTVTNPSGDAAYTPAQYAAVLADVTYKDGGADTTTSGSHPTRTLTWIAYDGEGGNPVSTSYNEQTTTLTINRPPTVALGTAAASYTGGGAAITLQSTGLMLKDLDGANITSATVTLTGGYAADGDTLTVNGSTSGFTVSTSADGAPETLTLTGSGTAAQYQALLNEVQYSSTQADPTNGGANGARTVSIQATDADSLTSTVASTETLTLHALATPTLSVTGATADAVQGGAPLTLLTNETVSSSANLTGATVTIASAQSGDVLAGLTNGTVDGVTVSGSGTPTLTLTGSASASTYQTLLSEVTYQDGVSADTAASGQHPTRTIDFSVSNAGGSSTTQTTSVTIDRPPAVTLGTTTASYTAGGAATTLQPSGHTLAISDPDGADAVSGATVVLTGGYANDGDTLRVNGSTGTLTLSDGAHVAVSFSGETLTLATTSGTATQADYQTLLNEVQYSSTASDPTSGGQDPNRTASFQVTDAGGAASTPRTETVAISLSAPTVTPVTPTVVEQGQSTEIGTAAPGVGGDTLTLIQTSGSGTVMLSLVNGVEEVIYTAPASVTSPSTDAVAYTVKDTTNNASSSGSANVTVDTTPTITLSAINNGQPVNASQAASGITIAGTTAGVQNNQKVVVDIYDIDNNNQLVGHFHTTVASNAWQVFVTGPEAQAVADGNYKVAADVSDAYAEAAQQATATVVVHETPPTISIAAVDGNNSVDAAQAAGGVTLSGITTGVQDNQKVVVDIYDTDNNNQLVGHFHTTVAANGWQVDVTPAQAQSIADGTYKITADVSDTYGNAANEATDTVTVNEHGAMTANAMQAAPAENFATFNALAAPVPSGETFAYSTIGDFTSTAPAIIGGFDPAKGDLIDLTALDSGLAAKFVSSFDGHAGEYELSLPDPSGYWHLYGDLSGSGHSDFQIAFNLTGALQDYSEVQSHIHL